MRTLFYLVISLFASFCLSLFFDANTGKLVLVLCGSMFFCTLHVMNLIVRTAELLGANDRKIFEAIRK